MAEINKDLESARKKLSANPPTPYDQLLPKEKAAIEAEYNFVTSIIMNDTSGQLITLFTNATKEGWDANRFKLEAEKTKWFRDRTASQEWFTIQNDGVADVLNKNGRKFKDLEQIRNDIYQTVLSTTVSLLGADVESPDVKAKIDKITNDILTTDYMNPSGWQSKLQQRISSEFKPTLKAGDILGGTISKTLADVRQSYRSLGLMLNDTAATQYAQGILSGTTDLNKINETLRRDASKMYSQFAERINAGETLQNILYPYTQMIGSMLEVDPESLDFTREDPNKPLSSQIDPLLQRALFSGADNKSVMSLTDLRKAIKKDERWQYTRNAEEEYAGITKSLMRMFGAGV